MAKINWPKLLQAGLLSALCFAVISTVLNYYSTSAGLYLQTPAIWREITELWLVAMVLYYLLFALIFTLVYALLYDGIPAKGSAKGIVYALLVFLILGVKSFLINYISTTLPFNLISIWTLGLVINLLAMGLIVGLIYQK